MRFNTVLLCGLLPFILLFPSDLWSYMPPTITGELKMWHKVTLQFEGPNTSESANPNPFTDYRLNVTFTNGNTTYIVPGYYAGDGNAAESSATSGNAWIVHFAPDKTGVWNYSTSFRSGTNVAMSLSANAGSSAGFMDGETGTFSISTTDKNGIDNRANGRLSYVGEHYLQYLGSGEFFVKAGADAPENTLAYEDFDDVPNRGNRRKSWQPHQSDYLASDAQSYTWQNGNGTELLGAIKYLSDKGMNAISFLTLSLHGDDENVFPYLLKVPINTYNGYNDAQQWSNGVHHDRFDVSRLAQWEKVFEYADKKGMFLHFKTLETENDNIMDSNSFGNERRIYYRELIARFSHHLALNWNLSEEITLSTSVINQTADYIKAIDPYDHIVVFHTYPGDKDLYENHYGQNNSVDGASIQTGDINNESSNRNDLIEQVTNSAATGKKWVVGYDEPGSANIGIDNDPNARKDVRHTVVWNALMSGSCGVEFYYGYQTNCTDLDCEDHRSRDQKYTDANYALQFFNNHLPFQEMIAVDNVTSQDGDYVFAKPGSIYAVYRPDGGNTAINLPAGTWQVQWYNPRAGGNLTSATSISTQLNAPDNNDWVALITIGCQAEGTPCDDGDVCTSQDMFDDNCTCLGTAEPDSDNDGICDDEDSCPGFDDTIDSDNDSIPDGCDNCDNNLTGTACDDENPCTFNDVFDTNCNCVGVSDNVIEMTALEDAYLQGATGLNNTLLRVENGNRMAYLKFDLTSITQTISNIELQISTESDGGNGTISIYKSNDVAWTETNLTAANAPANDLFVGSLSGDFSVGSSYSSTLNNIDNSGAFSIILVHEAGGNDVAFASSEFGNAAKQPKLLITIDEDCNEPNPNCEGYSEENGHVIIEVESLDATGTEWEFGTNFTGYTGQGHITWKGPNSFGSPGNGLLETTISIETPGTYRFQWRSRIGQGSNSTEHNDSWLRFPDADDFFGQRGASVVYPKGSGQTPVPNGSGADGWFKIYLSGSTSWTWTTKTSDNDGHDIFVSFDNPGDYTMQISGRSLDHVIDRIVLYLPSVANPLNLGIDETICSEISDCSVGALCDDGIDCSEGATFNEDCQCTGGVVLDEDNDGVCNSDDICPDGDDMIDADNDGIPDACDSCDNLLEGQACDDGIACSEGATIDDVCECTGGVVLDEDNDGVCNSDDICPDGDDMIDADNDGIPDACDSCDNLLIGEACDDNSDCTINDVYNSNCECIGQLIDDNNNGVCDERENTCEELSFSDFESTLGIWQSGGRDADRVESEFSPFGNYSARIRDNSLEESSIYSPSLDLSDVSYLEVEFSFRTIGLEPQEDFFLEISTNNGDSFTIVEEWNEGEEIVNGLLYNELVVIPYIELSAETIIRFRCDGTINDDQVFLDNITLRSCDPSCVLSIDDDSNAQQLFSQQAIDYIESNSIIPANAVSRFRAGDYVQLNERFEVELGAVFSASIYNCNN